MKNQKTIVFKNFKLNVFRNLMEQSLIVDNQLMFEISQNNIRSCSFSPTKSSIKLWTSIWDGLIHNEDELSDINLPSFETFNMYILKGDLFKKFLSVHTSETVDLSFNVIDNQAASLTITGKSENNNNLITTFVLTTEELIKNKVDDYNTIISEFSPSKTMFEFVLSDTQIQEIKRLVKKLHKSIPDNVAYLTFVVDCEEKKITVKDKVFTVDFKIDTEKHKFPEKTFSFNILKSDFIVTGNQTFTIWTEEESQKVIFGAKYSSSLIWCLIGKVQEQSDLSLDSSIVDSTIESVDCIDGLVGIEEYL